MSSPLLAPLTLDALNIWRAGVDAVDSARLVSSQIKQTPSGLEIAGHLWSPAKEGRLCVVGAGKAGAGMARGLEQALSPDWLARTTGWINVPDDCVQSLQRIHLHGARPAGVNEPTPAGVQGAEEILQMVRNLQPEDLCLVLISGGGSALLPAPRTGVTLKDKLQVTRLLMSCGATITELNTVRRSLSQIKGGGLLRACRAGQLIALIISDVIGDPLETIASGPTVTAEDSSQAALKLLQQFSSSKGVEFPSAVLALLEKQCEQPNELYELSKPGLSPMNRVIGNNRTAVHSAAEFARQLGYQVLEEEPDQPGEAASSGLLFAQKIAQHRSSPGDSRLCWVSGGETTVDLSAQSTTGKGGRNQEFALAATMTFLKYPDLAGKFALVSGGTDGEDGPTDAAGAWVDTEVLERIRRGGFRPESFLQQHNSYPFFESCQGLLKTGPTHTNVMDLRVGLLGPAG